MRGSLIGAVASLVAMIGIAGSAHASATVDLVWANTGKAFTSLAVSSTVTLDVVLTAGEQSLRGAGITLDYGAAQSALSVVGITNNPNMPSPDAMLPLVLGNTIDTGSSVRNLKAEVFPPFVRTGLMAGQSWLLGTITFHTTGRGQFSLSSELIGDDGVFLTSGESIAGRTTFNSAIVNIVPEPGTVALVGIGVLGLAVVGRRSS